ncbi:MAG TPA: GNAT family N-acetyltransferase [Rubricoccaceae bacterium]
MAVLRPATPDDAAAVCALILDLADYERLRDEARTTPEAIRRALDPAPGTPRLDVLLAFPDGTPPGAPGEAAVGFALFFPVFSTFRAAWGLYLEDLFVRPEHRGTGVGIALLRAVAQEAVRRGAGRLDWVVLDWNRPAIDFYRRLGAVPMDDWTGMRLTGDALQTLGADPAGG